MTVPRRSTQAERSERTRARILEAAEEVFARRGYEGARLDQIAERVGVHRASIFYYFEGKEDLYEQVLAQLFDSLSETIFKAADASEGEAAIEVGISAFVTFLAERPSAARILLRAAVDATPEDEQPADRRHLGKIVDRVTEILHESEEQGLCDPVDPVYLVMTVAGSILLSVTATPFLEGEWSYDAPSPEQLERHKREVSRIVRRLLGLSDLQ